MGKIKQFETISIDKLKPYKKNARKHSKSQIKLIAKSIKEFGFISPCLIDQEENIIAGHGRIEAAKTIGMKEVPCLRIEDLTPDQIKAYILADNRLTELGGWNFDIVKTEIEELNMSAFDIELTGFFSNGADWFEEHETGEEADNEEYAEFLQKFEKEFTTDDCYTPEIIYEAVANWVAQEYKLSRENFVRPFYPGGDYEQQIYKSTDIVVDNPPFSLQSKIVKFYVQNGIRFFLFCSGMTGLQTTKYGAQLLATGNTLTYENKAAVPTSFITNMEPDDIVIRSAPSLWAAINEAEKENRKGFNRELNKNEYPLEVLTVAMANRYSRYGVDFRVNRCETMLIDELDAQKENKVAIYGKGLLISEKAAAEKAAATKWELSEREKEIVQKLSPKC